MHGNAGNRLDNIEASQTFIELGLQYCVFDFVGCGLSEGETISLGFHESKDLEDLMNFLKGKYKISKFILYGRSMGAATSLFNAAITKHNVGGLVVDSSFADFYSMSGDIINLPKIMIDSLFQVIGKEILDKYKFSLADLRPIDSAQKIKIPAIFVHGTYDSLIKFSHSVNLHAVYGGPKELIPFDGDHNSPRPAKVKEKIYQFVKSLII